MQIALTSVSPDNGYVPSQVESEAMLELGTLTFTERKKKTTAFPFRASLLG